MYNEESLKKLGIYDLRKLLRSMGGTPGNKKVSELVEEILKIQTGEVVPKHNAKGRKAKSTVGEVFYGKDVKESKNGSKSDSVKGVFDPLDDGSGLIYTDDYNMNQSVFVSKTIVCDYGLEKGDYVVGVCEKDADDKNFLKHMQKINDVVANKFQRLDFYDGYEAIYPDKMLNLGDGGDLSLRLVDLFAPIGLGQRSVIVGDKKEGKTTLLNNILTQAKIADPEVYTIALLLAARPEDVAMYKKSSRPDQVAYVSTDEPESRFIAVAELVLTTAKRLVDAGKKVILAVDSLSYLYKIYAEVSAGGKAEAARLIKKYIMSAKNTEGRGNLGIVCTFAKSCEILEEVEEIANNVINLTTDYDIDVFPLIDAVNSETVNDFYLKGKEESNFSKNLKRKMLKGEIKYKDVISALEKTPANAQFIADFNTYFGK